MGSSASIAWPNTVLNTIVAESLDYVADQLEKCRRGQPHASQAAGWRVIAVLKELITEHKRVIFDGDNYSEEWHAEAERRGLPNLKDSVDGLWGASGQEECGAVQEVRVLSQAEHDSRTHIMIEKYIKQIAIEAETMVSIAREPDPACRPPHQQRLAETVAATKAAGVDCADTTAALRSFVDLVTGSGTPRPRWSRPRPTTMLIRSSTPPRSAVSSSRPWPSCASTVDTLETLVAADLWPLPTYRDLVVFEVGARAGDRLSAATG